MIAVMWYHTIWQTTQLSVLSFFYPFYPFCYHLDSFYPFYSFHYPLYSFYPFYPFCFFYSLYPLYVS